MARKSKDARIKELEETVEKLEKNCAKMREKADVEFGNSSLRYQLEEMCAFYEKIAKYQLLHFENEKKSIYKKLENARRIYLDNQELLKGKGVEYFPGITGNYFNENAYNELQNKVHNLQSKVDCKDAHIEILEKEIKHYQQLIGDYRRQGVESVEIQRLKGVMVHKQKNIALLEEQIKELNQRSATERKNQFLQEEISVLSGENQKLKEAAEEREISIALLREEIKGMKIDSEAEQRNRSLQEEISRLKEENQKLKQEKGEVTSELTQFIEYRSALEQHIREFANIVPIREGSKVRKEESMQVMSTESCNTKAGKKGRPKNIDDDKVKQIKELKAQGTSIRNIAKQLGVSVGSVHRYLK